MGAETCAAGKYVDKEIDPKTIARRNDLFNKYVSPFFNMIYSLCIKYSFDSANVQENYTEVLVNFYRRIETYDPSRPIRTWLHVVTKRQVLAMEKRRKAKSDLDNDDNNIEMFGGDVFDNDKASSNVLTVDNYREHYSDDVLAVLEAMKPIHRHALLLQESGYSIKEIVEIEYRNGTLKSRNVETIKSRLFLARQYLKKHLTRDGKRIFDKADDEDVCGDCDQAD